MSSPQQLRDEANRFRHDGDNYQQKMYDKADEKDKEAEKREQEIELAEKLIREAEEQKRKAEQ